MRINLQVDAESADVARWAAESHVLVGYGWDDNDSAAIEGLLLKNTAFRQRMLILYFAAKQQDGRPGRPSAR